MFKKLQQKIFTNQTYKKMNLQKQYHSYQEIQNKLEINSQQSQNQQDTHINSINSQQKSIIDPHQYLKYCQINKKIKIMDQCNPLFPHVYLKDISLHFKGPMQDKAYSKNYSYYSNIRRGNTLCQIYDENQNQIDLFFCKRGMKKFFDLQKQYLEIKKIPKLKRQNQRQRSRIFQKIDQITIESKIHLFSIFKQNGEHCQITYVKKLNCWLFGSKNVAILARNEQDLQTHYQKIRFYWAKLIGKTFLQMIKQLSQGQIQNLKNQLDNKTLLGEHCGNQKHQHITKYEKIEIIFYALVQKTGQQHCMSVNYCKQFLKRYNFKMSKMKQVINLTDKNTIYKKIYQLLKQTAQGTMNEYGQGSVLYVVQDTKGQQKTIAMCKLKTCEYLIFRRLRQMLKLNVSKKSTANTFEKFKYDIENKLQNYFKPPRNIEFYFGIAKQAFKQAFNNKQITQNYLRYKFVDFLSKISINQKIQQKKAKIIKKNILVICLPRFTQKLQKYAKSQNLKCEYMYRHSSPSNKSQNYSLYILHMIPRLPQDLNQISKNLQIFIYNYSLQQIQQIQKQLNQFKDITKSHLISFVKSQQKNKMIKLLLEKIKIFQETLIKKGIKVNVISQDINQKDQYVIQKIQSLKSEIQIQKSQKQIQNQINKLIVIFPILLPGSGKTYLFNELKNKLEEKNINYEIIKSDQIRKKHMIQNLSSKGFQLNLQQKQYNQTFKQVKDQVYNEYKEKLNKIIESHAESKQKHIKIVIIDKVFGPYFISKQIEQIKQYSNVLPLIILPSTNKQFQMKNCQFPFNLQYILICLKRCIQRSQHQTMTSRPEQICSIFLWFLKFFNNTNWKKLQTNILLKNQTCIFSKVQTVIIDQNCQTHSFLKKKLQEAYETNNKNKIIQLIEQIYKNNEYLHDIYKEQNRNTASQKLIKLILQQINRKN